MTLHEAIALAVQARNHNPLISDQVTEDMEQTFREVEEILKDLNLYLNKRRGIVSELNLKFNDRIKRLLGEVG